MFSYKLKEINQQICTEYIQGPGWYEGEVEEVSLWSEDVCM